MNTQLIALTLIAAVSTGAHAAAQDLLPKAAPQTRPVLLKGATLHTVSGEAFTGHLLFADGVIRSVAKDAPEIEGADVVDAAGKHVFPGFICAMSTLGLVEIDAVDMTLDTTEAGGLNPEVYAAVSVNPDSWHHPVTRRNGVLVAGVFPQGGTMPGRASVMQLDGWTWEDMALLRDAGLSINWPSLGQRSRRFGRGGGDPATQIKRIDGIFDAATAYLAAKKADPTIPTDLRYESMASVIAGKKPVYLSLATREQAESAIPWAMGRGLKPVIVGGRDALSFAGLLVRHDIPVALTGVHRLPHRRDLSYASTYELPRLLEEKGVRWSLTMGGRDSSNARNLPYEAAATVAFGLSPEAALRGITLSPAEALGVAHRVGSLEVGKDATLFLSDGHPFDLTSNIERAWIQGREITLEDKQTALAAKYRAKYRQKGLIPAESK